MTGRVLILGGTGEDGRRADNFHRVQRDSLLYLSRAFLRQFPEARVVGHNEVGGHKRRSHCPTLNMHQFRKLLKLRDINRTRKLYELIARTEKGPASHAADPDAIAPGHPHTALP